MTIKYHQRSRSLKFRFLAIFLGTFILVFGLLNTRYLYANVRYWVDPGTIVTKDSLDKARLLPLAGDISTKPLPDHAQLVIDSIGINAPIIFGVSTDDNDVYNNLEKGVVHYSSTPRPGQKGVSVVLGHSSAYPWYKGHYGSVFALLNKLNPGDKFYIQYEDNRVFVFQVKQSLVFNPFGDDARLKELEQSNVPSLILLSCWPVGTNYRRIAIQAELVQ